MAINGGTLFEWFANDADHADVAKLDVNDIRQQIHEIRGGDCDLHMTDLEIAWSIKLHAQRHVAEFGTLEEIGTPWSEYYRGSGRPTGRLAKEPVRMENGDAAPGWRWAGNMTRAEFDAWFEEEEQDHCE